MTQVKVATNSIVAVVGGHAMAMSLDGLKSNIRYAARKGRAYAPDQLYALVENPPNSLYSVRLLRLGKSIYQGEGHLYALVLMTGDHLVEFSLDLPEADS